jgi:hypothetical protein
MKENFGYGIPGTGIYPQKSHFFNGCKFKRTMQALLLTVVLNTTCKIICKSKRRPLCSAVKESAVPFVNGIVQSHFCQQIHCLCRTAGCSPLNNELQLFFSRKNRKFIGSSVSILTLSKLKRKDFYANQKILAWLDFRFAMWTPLQYI